MGPRNLCGRGVHWQGITGGNGGVTVSRTGAGPRSRVAAIALVSGLFVVSFAASAGATVALSQPSSDTAGSQSTAASTSDTAQEPTATSNVTLPYATSIEVQNRVARPKPASTKPTKSQVKDAKSTLCSSTPGDLPAVRSVMAPRDWTRVLEVLTANAGYPVGPVDGYYNNATASGLTKLQADVGTKPDGTFESADWSALSSLVCPAPEPPTPVYDTGGSSSSSGGSSSGGGTLVLQD